MMSFSELWRHFRLLSEPEGLPPDKAAFLEEFLRAEYARREQKRVHPLEGYFSLEKGVDIRPYREKLPGISTIGGAACPQAFCIMDSVSSAIHM